MTLPRNHALSWVHCLCRTTVTLAAVIFPFATSAGAAIVQVSVADHVVGGAASDGFGGVSYDQTSPDYKTNLAFDLYSPGYEGSHTWSAGKAAWTDSAGSIAYSDNAHQTVSPTPSFTNYQSDASMQSSFIDHFQVTQTSSMTLTSTQSGNSFNGSVWDNNVQVYSWNGSAVSPPVILNAGDDLRVQFSTAYQTLGGYRDFHGNPTFSDDFASSFQMDVTPVPEPTSIMAVLLGSALLIRNPRRRNCPAFRGGGLG
jgi:hypothetical protein